MTLYTSRFFNPELKKCIYTTVRISLGTPKWSLGYTLNGEMKDLMPFGLLNKYEMYEDFKKEYFQRLNRIGVSRIRAQFDDFAKFGRDIVLLCYEDIRKGPEEWCHRTAFAEWWQSKTGATICELPDPTPIKRGSKSSSKQVLEEQNIIPHSVQLSLF